MTSPGARWSQTILHAPIGRAEQRSAKAVNTRQIVNRRPPLSALLPPANAYIDIYPVDEILVLLDITAENWSAAIHQESSLTALLTQLPERGWLFE